MRLSTTTSRSASMFVIAMAAISLLCVGVWSAVSAADNATTDAPKKSDSPSSETKEAAPPKGAPKKGEGLAMKSVFEDDFTGNWAKEQTAWRVATWMQNKTQMSPERCATDGKTLLVQTVLAGDPPRGGSMESKAEYPYGRWLARLKPSAVPGVLNSMFTMDWDDKKTEDDGGDGSKFEVDIEFLTYTFGPKSGKVHLAVHVPEKKNAFVKDAELDFNPSDGFRNWGFDILPDKIVWHVDGEVIATWKRPPEYTFPSNYEMFFNSWTSKNWIKGPPAKDAKYQIDWVQFYPAEAEAE